MRNPFTLAIGWLRAGYPDDAPRTGYSPLIALGGTIALSDNQTQAVVGELDTGLCDRTDIAVAITRITDRLPDESQVRHVAGALRRRR